MQLDGERDLIVKYANCRIVRNHEIIKDDLWVRDGKVMNPEKLFFDEQRTADRRIDCGNRILAPGFIDLQINGAFGVDFSLNAKNVAEGLQLVAKGLLAHGVTSFCPTVITSPAELYHQVLPYYEKRDGSALGAGILGAHVEGPFISKEKKGAHPEQFILSNVQSIGDLERVYGSLDNIALVTLAPELPHALDVIEQLTGRNIVVSVGHSTGSLKDGEMAVRAGASFITHLFNAMLPFHHRDPGLVGLLTSYRIPKDRSIYYGMITDGIHTHPASLRIAHRVNPAGMVIVTDAVPAMGLACGRHTIGAQQVEIIGDRAVISGTNTLCGSIANMNQCVQRLFEATECSTVEALEAASLHPAQVLGISGRKGTLDYGRDADFVMLDDSLNVQATCIAGRQVWPQP